MKEINVGPETLLFSLRYAITRRSSAPSVVATDILKNVQNIETPYLYKFIEEVDKKTYPEDMNTLWTSFKYDIEFELNIRNKK